ncbi:MAG: hypothetical protein H6706_18740 [Myxococcales bacterium]|nr:hypothetical protein [Myxococcales bacterium]
MRAAFALLTLLALGLAGCGAGPTLAPAQAEARCAEVLAPADLPATVAEAEAARAAGGAWSPAAIRWIYVCRAYGIAAANRGWRAEGQAAEQRARQASDIRRVAKSTARAMMADQALAASLGQRDQEKYGDPEGPTFDWLVEKARASGLTGDAVYEDIVRSAAHTNDEVNASLGIPRLEAAW